jgi:hypothetical protein
MLLFICFLGIFLAIFWYPKLWFGFKLVDILINMLVKLIEGSFLVNNIN